MEYIKEQLNNTLNKVELNIEGKSAIGTRHISRPFSTKNLLKKS